MTDRKSLERQKTIEEYALRGLICNAIRTFTLATVSFSDVKTLEFTGFGDNVLKMKIDSDRKRIALEVKISEETVDSSSYNALGFIETANKLAKNIGKIENLIFFDKFGKPENPFETVEKIDGLLAEI